MPSGGLRPKRSQSEYVRLAKKRKVTVIGDYVNQVTPIEHECDTCDTGFTRAPVQVLRTAYGCPVCAIKLSRAKLQRPLSEYKEILASKFGNKIRIVSRLSSQKAVAYCKLHKREWVSSLGYLASGVGCPECKKLHVSNVLRTKFSWTLTKYKKEVKKVHEYSLVVVGEYLNQNTRVMHRCTSCDREWLAFPSMVLRGHGCSGCSNGKPFSKPANAWILSMSKQLRLAIMSQNTGKEHTVWSKTRTVYKLDGFNKRNNLAFEFLGDYWHNSNSDRYKQIVEKFQALIRLGFSIIYIWESEYYSGKEPILLTKDASLVNHLKSRLPLRIKLIQRRIRSV